MTSRTESISGEILEGCCCSYQEDVVVVVVEEDVGAVPQAVVDASDAQLARDGAAVVEEAQRRIRREESRNIFDFK